MKKVIPVILLLVSLCQIGSAQMLTPTVIAAAGGFASNANGSLSYTVGEMTMVQTFSANGNILTQGFQQPENNITGLIELSQGATGTFVLYPNPAVDKTWIGFEFPQAGRVSVTLFNELGQKITDIYDAQYESGKSIQTVDVSYLATGMYYMTLTFKGSDNKVNISTQKLNIIR